MSPPPPPVIASPKPAPCRPRPPPRAPPIRNLLDEDADADSAFRWAGAIATEDGQSAVLPAQGLVYSDIDENPRAGNLSPNIRSVSTASGVHATQEPEPTPGAATAAAATGISKDLGISSHQGYSQRPVPQDGGHIALRSGWLPAPGHSASGHGAQPQHSAAHTNQAYAQPASPAIATRAPPSQVSASERTSKTSVSPVLARGAGAPVLNREVIEDVLLKGSLNAFEAHLQASYGVNPGMQNGGAAGTAGARGEGGKEHSQSTARQLPPTATHSSSYTTIAPTSMYAAERGGLDRSRPPQQGSEVSATQVISPTPRCIHT